MALLAAKNVNIKATGTVVQIPKDNIRKLQYYLHTFDSCTGNNLPSDFTDYKSPGRLSAEEETQIVALALLFSPDELVGKVFFVLPDGHPALNGSNNEFYSVTEATSFIAAVDDIIVGGEHKEVTKVMVMNGRWLMNNYIEPIANEAPKIKRRIEFEEASKARREKEAKEKQEKLEKEKKANEERERFWLQERQKAKERSNEKLRESEMDTRERNLAERENRLREQELLQRERDLEERERRLKKNSCCTIL